MPKLHLRDGWRRLRVAFAVLAIATVAALAVWPSAAALECEGVALDDGCLFTITGGDTADPDDGFAVTNADGVPLYDFIRERDLQAIGYPISQRWMSGPFTLQAFQKVILQWDPGKRRMNYYNTLDVLANRYPEVELPNVPPHQVLEADRGADFATITQNHLALLEQNPTIKERFLSEPDWLNLYGLPIRYEEREAGGDPRGLQMLRAQRTVFVIWNVPAPGTTVGRVNLQNVPDKVKKLSNVIIPDAAKAPVARDPIAGPPARASAPLSDRDVLIALYDATDGPNWADNTKWLSHAPLGEWHGITTDAAGQITEVDLEENRLRGALPPALGDLSSVRWLNLKFNRLNGEIPPALGRLANLNALWLNYNDLRGEIPPALANLRELQDLRLSWNELTGTIPRELGGLANLTVLMLDQNQLQGEIPSELGRLSQLQWLELSVNQLGGEIPPELGRLGQLSSLSLWSNQLRGTIPVELGQLSKLRTLVLSNNQLSGEIPPVLGNLSNLVVLALATNRLTGTIPAALGNLSQLESLILHFNQLSGEIPPGLGRLSKLEALTLNDNQLSGTIPPELGNLSNLRTLWIVDNHLHGPIPREFGRLTSLKKLKLGGSNQLTGCIPEELRSVPDGDLNRLRLPFCDAEQGPSAEPAVPVPADTSTLSPADRAVLVALFHATDGANWTNNHNWLSEEPLDAWHGVVATATGQVTSLRLRENELTGGIPPELGRLANLRQLWLGRNQLTGNIPPELGDLANLESLDLRQNRLRGPIPPELGSLKRLWSLVLENNELSGAIPSELGALANLEVLSLSNNQLSGAIPPELGNLANLDELFLGTSNRLTGCIPEGLRGVRVSDLAWLGLPFC